MKKNILEATDEELQNLLENNTSDIKPIEYQNDILDFLTIYQIKSGTEFITSQLLYKFYKMWSKTPVSPNKFSTQVKYFISSNSAGYLINIPNMDILQNVVKQLKKPDKTKSKLFKQHFDNYLKKYDIKEGTFFVKDTILYNLYDKWTYGNKKRHPLSLNQFINFGKLYFESKYIDRNYWFAVDKTIIKHLTEDMKHELTNKKVTNENQGKNKKK